MSLWKGKILSFLVIMNNLYFRQNCITMQIPADRPDLFYTLALLSVENLGEQKFKALVKHFGSARNVFESYDKEILKVGGMGASILQSLRQFSNFNAIDKEIEFIEKNDIKVYYFFDKNYPKNLRQIPDAPSILFAKGNFDPDHPRQVAIVGTRNNSDHGKQTTEELIKNLAPYNVQIVSGLAYGIDIIAHRYCVDHHVSTVGVLAHGLDAMYPSVHKQTAKMMVENGGLLTEYMTKTKPDKFNFPMRNRIVAGLSEMTVVVESKIKGGALITGKLAASYDREVGAVPGRLRDEKSEGCNYLIKRNIAQLIDSAEDIVEILGWDAKPKMATQPRLFAELLPNEKLIIETLQQKENMHIDELMLKTNLNHSTLAAAMLSLELQQMVRPLSGKRYMLN